MNVRYELIEFANEIIDMNNEILRLKKENLLLKRELEECSNIVNEIKTANDKSINNILSILLNRNEKE